MTTFPLPSRPSFAFEGVVRLTRIGSAYLIFTLVIGFAALNTGNNSLYIGLTLMLGCLLLSGLASKGGLKGIEVKVEDIGEAWAGRPADTLLRIANRSRIWNVRDVVITADELPDALLVPLIPSRSDVTLVAPFLFRKRGRVELKRVDLYTRYPFGFFLKRRMVRLHGELIVFPRLLDGTGQQGRFRPAPGEESTANRPGIGTEIFSFRDYVRGDSLRQVYWRKSTTPGRWITKQTDQDAARTVHVFVDPFRPRGVSDDEFEAMISAATTFIYDALQRGFDVVLQLPRVTLRSRDRQAAHSMFRALALVEPSPEPVSQPIDRGTIVFSVLGGWHA